MNHNLELLKSLTLPDFPSGSSINFYQHKLFLIGDDASYILVLDENYHKVDAIHLFDSATKRIPKAEKADFETSAVLAMDGNDYLLVLGSGSRKNRMKLILVDLENEWSFESFHYREFINRIKATGIEEINIEGSALIGNRFILANRGNTSNPKNMFVITDKDFWQRQNEAALSVSELELPIGNTTFIGISELCYVESKDLLLITLSTEQTANAYDDGAIGDSYVGWINSFSQRVNEPNHKLSGMINLSEVAREFIGVKIEGLCVELTHPKDFIIHLISDNDAGESKLFKVRIT